MVLRVAAIHKIQLEIFKVFLFFLESIKQFLLAFAWLSAQLKNTFAYKVDPCAAFFFLHILSFMLTKIIP